MKVIMKGRKQFCFLNDKHIFAIIVKQAGARQAGHLFVFRCQSIQRRPDQSRVHHKKKRHHPIPPISMERFEVIKDFIWINRQHIVISLQLIS